jgi:hypothetical protein
MAHLELIKVWNLKITNDELKLIRKSLRGITLTTDEDAAADTLQTNLAAMQAGIITSEMTQAQRLLDHVNAREAV